MANEEQLKILEEGAKAWNKWRRVNSNIEINLEAADLHGISLYKANLRRANLRRVDFRIISAVFITRADFEKANLDEANFNGADLRRVKFIEASLNGVNFSRSNLRKVDFSGADLSNANLSKVKAFDTNFGKSILTGACIEDWHINTETNFEGVICDYIYLKENKQERRPSDPNRNFEPGEFAKLIEQSIYTVDLVFQEGIDWRAFLSSFQSLQVEYGSQNLSIQAVEAFPSIPNHNHNYLSPDFLEFSDTQETLIQKELYASNERPDSSTYTKLCNLRDKLNSQQATLKSQLKQVGEQLKLVQQQLNKFS